MLDLSTFTTEELEEMLETREQLVANMSFVANLPEIVQEIDDIRTFLGKEKEPEPRDDFYGKA